VKVREISEIEKIAGYNCLGNVERKEMARMINYAKWSKSFVAVRRRKM
jgi:hypothetical protein